MMATVRHMTLMNTVARLEFDDEIELRQHYLDWLFSSTADGTPEQVKPTGSKRPREGQVPLSRYKRA